MTASCESFALVTCALQRRYKNAFDFIHLAECKKNNIHFQWFNVLPKF